MERRDALVDVVFDSRFHSPKSDAKSEEETLQKAEGNEEESAPREVLMRLFLDTIVPLVKMTGIWIDEGRLQDPYHEFFLVEYIAI